MLVGIIPAVCKKLDRVDFLVGGDGSKMLALQEMVERERLQERVTCLGSVPHAQVRDVLTQGHVFLNCSLTESFCIAILEAASCGLLVVSTNVGGIPEVLPSDMTLLANPNIPDLVQRVLEAIKIQQGTGALDPWHAHERIKGMYSWGRVAEETLAIYDDSLNRRRLTFAERMQCYLSLGGLSGCVACLIMLTIEAWLLVVKIWQPQENIDRVPEL